MKQSRLTGNGGFIQIIFAVIVIVLVLTFFRFDLRGLIESDTGKSNFSYIWELVGKAWHWFLGFLAEVGSKLKDWLTGLTK